MIENRGGGWRARIRLKRSRAWLMPIVEIGVVLTLIAMATISYLTLTARANPDSWMAPATVAALLIANLVPAMALMVLIARRVAKRRAARSALGGNARLHVRLVALFSVIASVPTLLVVIFASFLFQNGVEFWFSDQARGILRNAATLASEARQEELRRVDLETVTMAGDLAVALEQAEYDSPGYSEFFSEQVYRRNLSEAILMRVTPENGIQALALVNPYERSLEQMVRPEAIGRLRSGLESVVLPGPNSFGAVARFPAGENIYLYAARIYEPNTTGAYLTTQQDRSNQISSAYNELFAQSRSLQLRLFGTLLAVSLLIVALAIWSALAIADRLVRPVEQLVGAARRVSGGDLSARVPDGKRQDEVGTLSEAFNAMTERLETQTGALVSANAQLESRRAFMEAVLAGVPAGVISVGPDRAVKLANSTAESLLATRGVSPVGRQLADVAPELDLLLTHGEDEGTVQFTQRGEPRTLAVKTVAVEGGHVLTFDDITEQLLDQRRAAWSDVARRIAHEIKNPLTPIQLAAERLQRRYGGEIASDAPTFEKLTGTIVRQVGDIRRMVDEFSSFARMPKPVFGEEALVDIARQALFLHEVAHPDIAFTLDAPEPPPSLVCDRRLLGQALTNIVKNGVEAIAQRREEGGAATIRDRIAMTIASDGPRLTVTVTDTGVGLPADRRRITEPYMTTRAKGTGLGLAIVKKIVEEHYGTLDFDDAPDGGTRVTIGFDTDALSRMAGGGVRQVEAVNG